MLGSLLMLLSYTTIAQNSAQADTVSITVYGNCELCKTRIESAAMATGKIKSAIWDQESHLLKVVPLTKKFSEDAIHHALTNAGHDTNKEQASDKTYDKLHACCKYRTTLSDIIPHYETEEEDHSGHDHAQHQSATTTSHNHTENEVCATVYEELENGDLKPLFGANVYWVGTSKGTVSDANGNFELPVTNKTNKLVVSFIGYGSDTLYIKKPEHYNIILKSGSLLGEVKVEYHLKSASLSRLSAIKTLNIGEGELLKAACCNLSESFATNPTVDVSFTDAVTGTRQIEMLGLAGPYVQITRENMPDIRGMASIYGFTYTPGPWVEGIQLNMGNGSVVNGFESMTGQINIELRKPEKSDPLFVNIYGNESGMVEANITTALPVSEKWSSGLMVHGKYLDRTMDHNGDGFTDDPRIKQFIGLNRWKYDGGDGLEAQFGLKGTFVDQVSGQVDFDEATDKGSTTVWGAGMATTRLEGWGKIGKVFHSKPYSSIGLQLSGTYHDQNNYFGTRNYISTQNSLYANLIYQSRFKTEAHTYKTGASFIADKIDETVENIGYKRDEKIPGLFFEYTYTPNENFSLVAGARADYHNQFGLFYTPRIHIKYAPIHGTVLRLTGGSGARTANIFAEHMGMFASQRIIYIENDADSNNPYGLDQEKVWNGGINLTQDVHIGKREAVFTFDYYHTKFDKQIITDFDVDAHSVYLYNLKGKSYANSLQAQVDYELIKRLDVRLAYRFNEVKRDYKTGLLDKPLSSQHRAFVNLGYATRDEWRFDFTLNWQGEKRIPTTESNSDAYNLNNFSPAFFMGMCQVSKAIGKHVELYAGVENLFDYTQKNPIISADDPFNPNFDSSLIWGPIFGRKTYAGIRINLGDNH